MVCEIIGPKIVTFFETGLLEVYININGYYGLCPGTWKCLRATIVLIL